MRVTLWITTPIHLDTLNKRFDPFLDINLDDLDDDIEGF